MSSSPSTTTILLDNGKHEVHLLANPWRVETSDPDLEEMYFTDNVNEALEDASCLEEALRVVREMWEEMQPEELVYVPDPNEAIGREPEEEDEEEHKATPENWQELNKFSRITNKRLMQDLMAIMSHDTAQFGFMIEQTNEDVLNRWQVKLFGFDQGTPIANDILRLQERTNKNFIELEMIFENDYPFSPPFVRVVYPRFQFRTGHITIGGSICMELLTTSGWRPTNDIESVIVQIRSEMIEGGARLDFRTDYPYTEKEARDAFHRVARDHGWQ